MSSYPKTRRQGRHSPGQSTEPKARPADCSHHLPMPGWLISRRQMLALAGSAAAMALAPAIPGAQAAPGRKFFKRREYDILKAFVDMLIPTDKVSKGALAAGVPEIIDARIAEAIDPEWRQSWRDDLEEVNRLSRAWTGRSFHRTSSKQRLRVMNKLARNEADPKRDGEYAFGTIKWETCDIYYRSEIGIHDDLKYQGNVLLDEFIGVDVSNDPAFPRSPQPPAKANDAARGGETSDDAPANDIKAE